VGQKITSPTMGKDTALLEISAIPLPIVKAAVD
jgi:hypothetical protein